MGMALPAGGHLTHGWSVSATGKWFRAVQYGVRKETGRVDMDEVRELALAERPKVIFCGGTAIPRTIDFPAFAEIAREVGARPGAPTSRTSPGWSPAAPTRRRSATPTSSPRPRTRPCAGRAAR